MEICSNSKAKLLVLVFWLISLSGIGQTFKIGVIADPDSKDRLGSITESIKTEIQKTLGSARTVEFDPELTFAVNWDQEKAKQSYRSLDGNCDLVLILGSVSARAILDIPALNTPTIAMGIFEPEIQGIPLTKDGTSGRANFSYILNVQDLEEDLKEFRRMAEFDQLGFVIFGKSNAGIDQEVAARKMQTIQKDLGAEINFITLNPEDIRGSLAELAEGTDAVFLAVPYELAPGQVKEIAEVLIEKDLPSFSMNKSYVEQGILASNSDDNGLDQMMRKLAIMVDEVVQNEPLDKMRVSLKSNKELHLNMVTARRLSYSAPFEIIFTADLVGNLNELDLPEYSLADILGQSLKENLNIAISQQDIALSEQDVKTAVSQFLPSVEYSATGAAINKGRANPLIGQAQFSVAGKGTLSQLIYSESAIANIRIQKLLQEAQTYATDQQILDVTLDVVSAYLGILRANTNVLILEENLQKSKANLELAKQRESLGAASSADVFRWKGEVATSRQSLIEAQAGMFIAKAQLNALLNGTLGNDFKITDLLIDGPLFTSFSKSTLAEYVKSPFELRLITEFLVLEAKNNYPSKKQLNTNAELLDRQKVLNKRLYYTPTVAAQAQLDNTFWRGGEGSTAVQGTEFINNNWNAGLSVSIPLFDGNRRSINLQTTQIQQEQLNNQLDNLDRSLELSVRANTLDLLVASTNIGNSAVSADNTAKNFDLVQNLYRKGQANIIQLLDAQQASLQTKQAYALSIYDYLLAFITLENSIGSYSMLSSQEEQDALLDRWNDFLTKKKEETK